MAKARRNPDFMAGRDVRHQNEAQTCEKTRCRKADKEVLNPSLIGGKACRGQNTTHDAAIKQASLAKAKRNPDCMGGRDVRDQNESKKCEKTRFRKAVGEVLTPSLIGGKACRGQHTTHDAAIQQESVAKARRNPD